MPQKPFKYPLEDLKVFRTCPFPHDWTGPKVSPALRSFSAWPCPSSQKPKVYCGF